MTASPTDGNGRRSRLLTIGVPVLVVLGVLAAAVWYFFIRDDAPEAFTIEDATADDGDGSDEGAALAAEPLDSPDGTWVVAPDIGPGGASSEAGYRVNEVLADVGDKTVVGRTDGVDGTVTIDGTSVTEVSVTVDMASVQTDSNSRDGQFRRALDVDTFPTATFTLTEPIDLGTVPADGESISVTAVGDLTIHGVSRSVEVTLDAQLDGSRLTVVGQAPVVFSDFDVDKPQAQIVLSLDDDGLIEFQLYLRQDAGSE